MSSLEDLRASQDRDLRREGIPMIVVLRDERPQASAVQAVTVDSREGRELADRLDALRADLAPSLRDGDMGVVTALLTVAAYDDFGRGSVKETR